MTPATAGTAALWTQARKTAIPRPATYRREADNMRTLWKATKIIAAFIGGALVGLIGYAFALATFSPY